MPFTSVILDPGGRVCGCRVQGSEFVIGDLSRQSLDEIWNSSLLRKWRSEFIRGEPTICKKQVVVQRCNLCPEYNSLLPLVDPTEIQLNAPRRIALNLGGECNLRCRMCNIWKEPNGYYLKKEVWEKILPWVAQVKELELFSGEPFIQEDTRWLVDEVSRVNPECIWSITTNGHWDWNAELSNLLDRIRFKTLIVSIDSLNADIFSKIRRGGRLDIVLENLAHLQAYDKSRLERGLGSLNLRINYLVQQDNWVESGAFHDFGERLGIPVSRIILAEPAEYSLLSLDEVKRIEILRTCRSAFTQPQFEASRRLVVALLHSLTPLSRAGVLLDMQERTSA